MKEQEQERKEKNDDGKVEKNFMYAENMKKKVAKNLLLNMCAFNLELRSFSRSSAQFYIRNHPKYENNNPPVSILLS